MSQKLFVVGFISLGLLAASGCASSNDPPGGGGGGGQTAGSSGTLGNDGGPDAQSSDDYDNPLEPISVGDAGNTWNTDDASVPSCGASRIEAEQIVVETTIDVPVEVSAEVSVEVPVEVTSVVSEEVTTTKPLSLYIMFDKSQSMGDSPSVGNHLWDPAVSAVKSFLNDTKSAGTGVALQYFPIGGGSCGGGGYSTPSVGLGRLPANAATLTTSLDNHDPDGGNTPIEGALRGVTTFCKTYQTAHPSEQCVAVLVTDGEPCSSYGCTCNSNFDALAGIAADAKLAGVITVVVGLNGANFTLLDAIARAGGAPDCDLTSNRFACDVSANTSKLSEALASIREKVVITETHTETHTVTQIVTHTETHIETHTEVIQQVEHNPLPCEWSIPASPEGQVFDQDKVNIRLTSGDNQSTFARVRSQAACGANGWYYNDPNEPTRFIACEQTCEGIKTAPDATIDILLGCATITLN